MRKLNRTPEELRDMQRVRYRRWREKNPDGSRIAAKKHRDKVGATPWPAKREMGIWVTNYKATTPCKDCKAVFPAECMDFDHIHGTKEYCVGTMVAHGHNKQKILDEIAKCDLVCSNCHRIRTRKRRVYGKTRIQELP